VISPRFLTYVVVAFAACFLLRIGLGYQAMPLDLAEYATAVAFGIALHLLIIVRLQVFRSFYAPRRHAIEQRPRSMADLQAAPALSMLIAGGAAGLLAANFYGQHATQLGLCAGLAAGVMSFYSAFR
jgi:hypothetical protein